MAKILVIEDDPKIALLITSLLVSAGHDPLAADTGNRALEFLRAEPGIDLLILDQHLAEKSDTGLALLALVRASPPHAETPVIVCSGDTQPDAVRGFLALRIAAFVKKPFRPERLLADVERVLRDHAARIASMLETPTRVIRGA